MHRVRMNKLRRFWFWFLPNGFFYADQLTVSAKRSLARVGVGLLGLLAGVGALGLLRYASWQDVLAGALLAWGVSMIAWAAATYRSARQDIHAELRRTAEIDLLHARLNHLAAQVGARSLVIDHELEHVLGARIERLAHFAGLDEFRGEYTTSAAQDFWDATALGYIARDDSGDRGSVG